MAKRKRKQDRAVGQGLAGSVAAGAATFLASQAVKTVVKEVVEAGTDRFLFRRSKTKPKGQDVGLLVLRRLAESASGEPVTVVRLVQWLNLHLLDVSDVVRGLRRLRLVKYVDGHRAVRLTSQGRETLEALAGPEGPAGAGPESETAAVEAEPSGEADATADVPPGDDGAVTRPPADEGA